MEQTRSKSYNDKNVEEDQIDYDVVIVGAGVSGLTAANRLVSAGLSVQILEKANYAGGRLLSKKDSESFYAHELQNRLNFMIQRLKLSKVVEVMGNDRKILHLKDNEILETPFYVPGEVHSFIRMMNSISEKITFPYYAHKEMNKKLSTVSVEDLLCRLVFFEKSRAICRNLIFVTCGITNLDDMSALWYLIMLSGAGGFIPRLRANLGDSDRFYVKGGLMSITQLLIEKVEKPNPIRYSETVKKIQFNDDRAHVWTNKNAHYKCEYVIVAVPPRESTEIAIEPRLPQNVRMTQSSFEKGKNVFFNGIISNLHSGQERNSSKCLVDAEGTESNLRLAYDARYGDQLRVSGFLSTATGADSTARNDLISTLKESFSPSISNFDEYTETDWSSIPTGSPMNVLRPGSFRYHANLLLHTHGRVFFAASEYAKHWPGTVDGAIEAGESSACSVLVNMRPQSMNRYEWISYKSESLSHLTEELNAGIILAHNICFWINLYISLSFLRTAILSLQSWY